MFRSRKRVILAVITSTVLSTCFVANCIYEYRTKYAWLDEAAICDGFADRFKTATRWSEIRRFLDAEGFSHADEPDETGRALAILRDIGGGGIIQRDIQLRFQFEGNELLKCECEELLTGW